MRQHSNLAKDTAEKVVKDIRRATREQYSAEKRSGSFWRACAARTASPSCAAARVSRRGCPSDCRVLQGPVSFLRRRGARRERDTNPRRSSSRLGELILANAAGQIYPLLA
jgi:hypothetical protein